MTWRVWLSIWGVSLVFTAVSCGLIFLLGFWAFPLVLVPLIVAVGFVVVE